LSKIIRQIPTRKLSITLILNILIPFFKKTAQFKHINHFLNDSLITERALLKRRSHQQMFNDAHPLIYHGQFTPKKLLII